MPIDAGQSPDVLPPCASPPFTSSALPGEVPDPLAVVVPRHEPPPPVSPPSPAGRLGRRAHILGRRRPLHRRRRRRRSRVAAPLMRTAVAPPPPGSSACRRFCTLLGASENCGNVEALMTLRLGTSPREPSACAKHHKAIERHLPLRHCDRMGTIRAKCAVVSVAPPSSHTRTGKATRLLECNAHQSR